MFNFLSKVIYPYSCLSCGKELNKLYLCDDCFQCIGYLKEQKCPVCEQSSLYGMTHVKCQNKTPLNGVFVATNYKEDIIKKLIHGYKYKFLKDNLYQITSILTGAVENNLKNFNFNNPTPSSLSDILLSQSTIITSVPLHKLRLRWRGFNQSEEIAKKLAKNFNTPYVNLLSRIKNNPTQQSIQSTESRAFNIKKAFTQANDVSDKKYQNKEIIIVDDITTTLSTLNECAKILKEFQPKAIYGIVVARSQRDN